MSEAHLLLPVELEAIARRIAREPRYRSDSDCDQAFRDRRDLLGHLMALEIAGDHALDVIANAGIDLDEARRLIREEHDRR